MSEPMLVLASKSKARKAMLEAAGLTVVALAPDVDEHALKDRLKAAGITASDMAVALAETKALQLSQQIGSALVLGGDQLLSLEDGTTLNKPKDKNDAKAHLKTLSGNKHTLFSAAVIADQGKVTWRHVDRAVMTMRDLSDAFIDHYVEDEWAHIRHCVGCYEIERRGAQLFAAIQGSHFTIIGLPLLDLLTYLRLRGVLPS